MNIKTTEGMLNGEGLKFAVAVSRFNDFITGKLLEGALDALARHGAREADIEIARAPGAFELPQLAQRLAMSKRYDAVICLGAVIRGATSHYELVCGEAARGIAQAAMGSGVPVIFGVVTADNLEQAIERAGSKQGNKGAQAAAAAIEMADLWRKLKK
ncbi:MAG: 6,7-dimethyl-8-ribityllumazine synthase [Elusimicrobiales bacterium]